MVGGEVFRGRGSTSSRTLSSSWTPTSSRRTLTSSRTPTSNPHSTSSSPPSLLLVGQADRDFVQALLLHPLLHPLLGGAAAPWGRPLGGSPAPLLVSPCNQGNLWVDGVLFRTRSAVLS